MYIFSIVLSFEAITVNLFLVTQQMLTLLLAQQIHFLPTRFYKKNTIFYYDSNNNIKN